MELTLVPLLLPAIQKTFGLSIGELAWVFNSYGIAVALGVLLGGWLGDVFGTRTVFSTGVLFFSFGSILVAASGNYELLISGRILQGFGGGVFSPLIPVLLTFASPERPGRVLIVWGSVAGYVAAFAPVLYGSMLDRFGWNLAFALFAVISLVGLVIVQRSQVGIDKPARPTSLPSYFTLFRSRALCVMFAYVFCTYGAITYFLFRLPLMLADSDFRVLSIGLVLSIMWLSFSFVSTLLRNSVDAPHIRSILLSAPALIALGFALSYVCRDVECLALTSILVGAGLACSNAPSTQLILNFAPKGMSAVSASLDITFARLGGAATVAILSQSYYGLAVVSIVVLSVIAFLCASIAAKLHVDQPEPAMPGNHSLTDVEVPNSPDN
jgi:MFS family permease